MAELTRQPAGEGAAEGQHDQTIETLLIAGLDLYFAGEYDRAIHAWTRVLFLDRAHARARAYIERARAVLAERQRETDELLHRGLTALDAGDTTDARQLLVSAVERGGVVEEAEVALERLGRLSVAGLQTPVVSPLVPLGEAERTDRRHRGRRWVPVVMAAAAVPLLLVAVALALGWDPLGTPLPGIVPRPRAALSPVSDDSLPSPALSQIALRRARALFARGHLHEALMELGRIGDDDPQSSEANRVKAQVQRALLDAAAVPGAFSGAPTRDP